MDFKDYYKILGIAETADAKTIKTAYRKLARKYHPDVNTDNNTEDKFKEVAEAYAVLKNTQKRSEYDELRKYGKGGHSFEPPPGWQSSRQAHPDQEQYTGDFSEFFESVFTQGRGQSQHSFHQKGQDVETDLPLFLEDTLSDKPKTISIDIPYINEHGQRQVTKKTLNVKIPRGTIDGECIRLKGQGAPGIGNGQRGDLYLYIKLVPHPLFDAHGADLNIIVPLTPWEAALGSKITLPTLEGKIQLTISANSQTGRRLRIKGKGLYHHEKRGDLYAVLKVTMPDHISEDEKELWQAMAEKNTYNPRSEWEA